MRSLAIVGGLPSVLWISVLLTFEFLQEVGCVHTTICMAALTPDFISGPYSENRWMRYGNGQKSFGIEKFHNLDYHYRMFFEPRTAGLIDDQNDNHRAFASKKYPYVPKTTLKVYRIKQKFPEKYLRGWYRVELCGVGFGDWSVVLLTVRDDSNRRQDVGEMSLNFPSGADVNDCPKSSATRYMILSCGGASRSEPLVSNGFNFNRHGYDYTLGYTIDDPYIKCFNVYMRIPIQDCNQKKTLVFEIRMHLYHYDFVFIIKRAYLRLTSNPTDGTYIQGAADAIPSKTRAKGLDCSEEITTGNVPWFAMQTSTPTMKNFENTDVGQDNPDDDKIDFIRACQARHFQGRCGDNMCTLVRKVSSWYDTERRGLRTLSHQNTAVENQIPICEHELPKEPNYYGMNCGDTYQPPTKFNTVKAKFVDTHEYLKTNHVPCEFGYKNLVTCTIKGPIKTKDTPPKAPLRSLMEDRSLPDDVALSYDGFDGPAPRQANANENRATTPKPAEKTAYTGNGFDPELDKYRGIAFNGTGFPQLLWACRKGHATLMTIVMLLILPINLFMTRYFKETFMGSRILYTRVWYVVHVHATFFTICFLLAGLVVGLIAGRYMGHSLTLPAIIHRALGYTGVGLFVLMTLLGGVRGFEDPLRRITITLHWIFGQLFYLIMVALFLSAVFIPGSGVTSGKRDMSMTWQWINKNSMTEPSWFIASLLHVPIWIGIEVVFHIILTVLVCQHDKVMQVVERRIFFPLYIPVLRDLSQKDASGFLPRFVLFCIYLCLAFLSCAIYFLLNIVLTWSYSDIHDYSLGAGPMSCTHFPGNYSIRLNWRSSCQ